MDHKIADIERPDKDEKDVILMDSMQDFDSLFVDTIQKIREQFQVGV